MSTINSDGEVFSDKTGKMKTRNKGDTDYQIINFMKIDGKKKTYRLHRLVLMAFDPRDDMDSLEVNHKDGNKKNNKLENLEWCTRSENVNYGTRTEKQAKALSVKVVQLKDGEPIKIWDSMNQAKRECGFNVGNISKCCRNLMSCYKGFEWKYLSDYAGEQTVVH